LPEALAIAETVLPPRSTVGGSFGFPGPPAESVRWMTLLKNC
jgi:hypothetical protein